MKGIGFCFLFIGWALIHVATTAFGNNIFPASVTEAIVDCVGLGVCMYGAYMVYKGENNGKN